MAQKVTASKKYKDRFTVIVEGNIGSGKTTFLNHFKKYEDLTVLAEPIELWRNCKGHNLLGLMYQDPKKWAFTFQSYVQLTMLQNHTCVTPHPVKLMERSVYSAKNCFVEKMAKDGTLTDAHVSVIEDWFKWARLNLNIEVDLIVYLRTTPEVAHKRIMQRNRAEEKSVSLEYLKELHEIHENWLYHMNSYLVPAPVLVLDANLDKSCIIKEYERVEPHILYQIAKKARE